MTSTTTSGRTVVCVACFVSAFSFVACMSSCALRTRPAHANARHTMCLNSLHVFMLYAIRFSIFHRDCLFLPRTRRITRGSLFRERVGKRRIAKEAGERERQPLASKFHRSRATIVTHYLTTLCASRVETNGVTFCNYTPSGRCRLRVVIDHAFLRFVSKFTTSK